MRYNFVMGTRIKEQEQEEGRQKQPGDEQRRRSESSWNEAKPAASRGQKSIVSQRGTTTKAANVSTHAMVEEENQENSLYW